MNFNENQRSFIFQHLGEIALQYQEQISAISLFYLKKIFINKNSKKDVFK